MPEAPEIRIMSDFINQNSKNFRFKKLFHVEKGNNEFGGGELINWSNPIYKSRIDEWIRFYGRKEICVRQKFGTRNVWINRKWKIIK